MAEKETKKMGRRDFLKIGGMGAAGVVATGVAGKISAAQKAVAGTRRLGMVIDLRKCYGCHACSVSCKAEFNVPLGFWRSWVTVAEKGSFPHVSRHFLPRLCNHCKDAPCVTVCPTHATYKREDGIVMQKDKDCIGCKTCIAACPYDVRFRHPDKKVVNRCDFCVHRIDNGYVPSCVNACPAGARIFGDLNDPKSEIHKIVSRNPVQVLRPEMNTNPHVFYIGLDSYSTQVSIKHNYR